MWTLNTLCICIITAIITSNHMYSKVVKWCNVPILLRARVWTCVNAYVRMLSLCCGMCVAFAHQFDNFECNTCNCRTHFEKLCRQAAAVVTNVDVTVRPSVRRSLDTDWIKLHTKPINGKHNKCTKTHFDRRKHHLTMDLVLFLLRQFDEKILTPNRIHWIDLIWSTQFTIQFDLFCFSTNSKTKLCDRISIIQWFSMPLTVLYCVNNEYARNSHLNFLFVWNQFMVQRSVSNPKTVRKFNTRSDRINNTHARKAFARLKLTCNNKSKLNSVTEKRKLHQMISPAHTHIVVVVKTACRDFWTKKMWVFVVRFFVVRSSSFKWKR